MSVFFKPRVTGRISSTSDLFIFGQKALTNVALLPVMTNNIKRWNSKKNICFEKLINLLIFIISIHKRSAFAFVLKRVQQRPQRLSGKHRE